MVSDQLCDYISGHEDQKDWVSLGQALIVRGSSRCLLVHLDVCFKLLSREETVASEVGVLVSVVFDCFHGIFVDFCDYGGSCSTFWRKAVDWYMIRTLIINNLTA